MDAVELGRQRAADLHRKGVELGDDPWRPYDFAVAEAKRRGFDVEPTSRGAAVLDGSRATLVAAHRLIVHEDTGSPFDQAFLVLPPAEVLVASTGVIGVELDYALIDKALPKLIRRAPQSRRRSASIASSIMDDDSGARFRWTCSRGNSCFPARP